jgi:tRNA-Thr(GGU) m(6)t(6)A37 methyltransferase TsaA
MVEDEIREGEVRLDRDPATMTPDAGLVFIGRAVTPWASRDDCPKNLRQARERAAGMADARFALQIDQPYRAGLEGLEVGQAVIVLYWMHQARRDLVVQAPRHAEVVRGTFALRSPVRPNPVALAAVRVRAIDPQAGVIEIDGIDCANGTPIVDVKPWLEGIDVPPRD